MDRVDSRSKQQLSYLEALAINLQNASKQNDTVEILIILRQVAEAVSSPGDLSCLIGPVIKLLPCHDLQVKKNIYSILPRICVAHPETALLVANTIVCDTKDPNPVVKCMSITALASISPLHQDHVCAVLREGLKDGNPHVRLSAITGCGTVFRKTPSVIVEHNFVDRLYSCIRDPDPVVVTSSLIVLDTILATEGGVVVNRSIAEYLLRRLTDFPHPQLATVLQVLRKYTPDNEEELFQELSLLDPYLVYPTSAAVVVNCVRLFLKLTSGTYPKLKYEIIERSVPVLKDFMVTKASKDSTSHVLDFLLDINNRDPDWLKSFSDSPHLFYPKEMSDLSSSLKRLQILPYLCNDSNYKDLLTVLDDKYCRHETLSVHAINCIVVISKRVSDSVRSECMCILISLLDCPNVQISNNVLEILQDLNLSTFDRNDVELLFDKVILKVNLSDKTHRIPSILLRLMGDFGIKNEKSPYVMETLAENFLCYEEGFKCLTLTCAVKLFLQEPAKYQHTLGEIFEKCMNSNDDDLSLELAHQAQKYYEFLKCDVQLIKKILLPNNIMAKVSN